ncbi:MAG: LysM peptidoglycan-binding domain-containing protein [Chloroflexota bacterium]|nr:LysM peptidoglycan-binding domain-containing protein [Chloroflexota bacterium]
MLGTAITALALADGPRPSWWLLLGLFLLADGVLRLLSLGRIAWPVATALGGMLAVVAVSFAVLSWGRTPDRAAEREVGSIPAPVGTARAPALSPPPAASPAMTPSATAPRPATPVPSSPSATPAPLRYVVRPGDTLINIAAFFGVRTQDLIALNRLPPDGQILAGQELIIPRSP